MKRVLLLVLLTVGLLLPAMGGNTPPHRAVTLEVPTPFNSATLSPRKEPVPTPLQGFAKQTQARREAAAALYQREVKQLTAEAEALPLLSDYAAIHEVEPEAVLLAARVAMLEGGFQEDSARAVLSVIYNRCMAPRFGGEVTDIAGEVFRKGQFSVIGHKHFDTLEVPDKMLDWAWDVFLNGNTSLPDNVLFFCAQRMGKGWGNRKYYKNIGGNLFFYGSTQ